MANNQMQILRRFICLSCNYKKIHRISNLRFAIGLFHQQWIEACITAHHKRIISGNWMGKDTMDLKPFLEQRFDLFEMKFFWVNMLG